MKATNRKQSAKDTVRSDVIVTARVPAEIKKQGDAALKKIGSTPTELIRSAYGFVLKNNKLPDVHPSLSELAGKHRVLTDDQRELVQERARRTTFAVPASHWQGKTDDDLLEEALREKYENLA